MVEESSPAVVVVGDGSRFKVTVTLKSGVQLVAECDSFKTSRNVFGELLKVEWENLSTQWPYLNLSEVAAIEVLDLNPPETP